MSPRSTIAITASALVLSWIGLNHVVDSVGSNAVNAIANNIESQTKIESDWSKASYAFSSKRGFVAEESWSRNFGVKLEHRSWGKHIPGRIAGWNIEGKGYDGRVSFYSDTLKHPITARPEQGPAGPRLVFQVAEPEPISATIVKFGEVKTDGGKIKAWAPQPDVQKANNKAKKDLCDFAYDTSRHNMAAKRADVEATVQETLKAAGVTDARVEFVKHDPQKLPECP